MLAYSFTIVEFIVSLFTNVQLPPIIESSPEFESEFMGEYANDSKIKYNSSTINNSSIIYINGKLNSSNSSLENVTELYLANGKSFVLADISNGNLDYSQAKNIVNSLFS